MITKKAKGPATGPANQAQVRFNENANSDKVSETGLDFFWGGGLLGALNAGVIIKSNRPIYVFNTDLVNIHFVALGDTGLAAPAGAATGIPIAPGTGIMLASGPNTVIRSSNAAVFGYQADDNVVDGN